MKSKEIVALVVSVMMFLTVGLYAVEQNQPVKKISVTHKKKMKAKKSEVWSCPMKCEGEKTYGQLGKCSKCGMNLEKKK